MCIYFIISFAVVIVVVVVVVVSVDLVLFAFASYPNEYEIVCRIHSNIIFVELYYGWLRK